MCGIVTRSSRIRPIDRRSFSLANEKLFHRGPDEGGVWYTADGRTALGSRRLAILDLTADGHMPMTSAGERVVITFNGEIYNHRELRRHLASLGHKFRGHSDTEVLLSAYLEWGTDVCKHIEGMFAFAIYDDRLDPLIFVARDRSGEKPLYYHFSDSHFSVGSEMKVLLEDKDVSRAVDRRAIASFLANGFTIAPNTIVKGINKLAPGTSATVKLNRWELAVSRYWQCPRATFSTDPKEDMTSCLETLLSESVRQRLVADVPVAVWLSSGLDSTIVAALAQRQYQDEGKKVLTITGRFGQSTALDEGIFARNVAKVLGTNHLEVDLSQRPGMDVLRRISKHCDEPLADPSTIPTFQLAQKTREHATVVLAGDGGDELFGGYHHYSPPEYVPLIRRCPHVIRRCLNGLVSMVPLGQPGRSHLQAILGIESTWRLAAPIFDRSMRSRLGITEEVYGLSRDTIDRAALLEYADRAMYLDFMTYLPDDVLQKVDRTSMASSVEVRSPWLAENIVEFAFERVRLIDKVADGDLKILPRRLAERLVPASMLSRRKMGFSPPIAAWFANEDLMSEMEWVCLEQLAGTFSRRVIKEVFTGQRQGRTNTIRIYALTMLALWCETTGLDL